MARSRRLSVAFLVALALAALVAAATVAGGERRVAVADGGAGTTLQSQHTEPALTPAKRQSAEQVSFVVVAVLAVLAGAVTTGASARRLVGRRRAPRAVPRRAVRLRGPPVVLFSS
ncbi:MAG: hypothetical protein ACRD2W_24635 [Acidimicrobiales bacterium]